MSEGNRLPIYHPACLLSTWFGVGLIPKAPGTFGSIAALPFAYAIQVNAGNMALLMAALLLFLIGWPVASTYVRLTGRDDPKEVVIDEVAGQWLLLSVMFPTAASYLIGFLFFRLFDIAKPWPISWCDRKIGGGLGVMLDDILAAMMPVLLVALMQLLANWLALPFSVNNLMTVLAYPNVF